MSDETSVFDSTGHVELVSYDVISDVLKELYEKQPGKWRGTISALPLLPDATEWSPNYTLNLSPEPPAADRPGFLAVVGDHLQKMPFGVVMKITPAEYAEYQTQLTEDGS
jgi:hypothetical protein